jgi:hypothetical protein
MITVPVVLRRFFGSIDDGSGVNDLLGRLLEIAFWAAVKSSKSALIESVEAGAPASPTILRFRLRESYEWQAIGKA